MPQICQVLCCYNCEMFQVQFVNKSSKWQCKVCNKKQSLKKAFKIGSAPECRSLVQEFNMQRGCQKLNENIQKWEETDKLESEIYAEDDPMDQYNTYNRSAEDVESEVRYSKHNKFTPNNSCEFQDENFSCENLFTENIKVISTAETSNKSNNVISNLHQNTSFSLPVVDDSMEVNFVQKKRPFEAGSDFSSSAAKPPPFKKNRGFQIIKNAALKLS